ncbi:hypothetical protein MMC07_005830 [Pseudocyphellaria aurata]|nr:hypothetical protein [Pseudocyphellaria aurata]
MAHYQQSAYEAPPNRSQRQRPPEDASQPYHPTSHNNFAGDQGFNFNEYPSYDSTQQHSDDRYGPQGGYPRHYGERGHYGGRGQSGNRFYDGRSERNGGRGQNIYRGQDGIFSHDGGDMRRPFEQERTFGPERRAYTDSRAHGQTRPNQAPSNHEFMAPKYGQSQEQAQNEQSRHHGMPKEPVFEEEPREVSSVNYGSAEGYHESQGYHLPSQHYPDNRDTNSANLNERFVLNNQQQDYGEAYRQEISQGSSGYTPDYSYNDTSRSQLGKGQPKTRADDIQNTKIHKSPPKRNLASPISHETKSWDSPFPTFPVNKGKVPSSGHVGLNESVAGMSLNNDHRDRRPQTASSKSSQVSAWPAERRPHVNDTPEPSFPTAQKPPEHHYSGQSRVQPQRPEYQSSGRSQFQPDLSGAGSTSQVESRIGIGRRSEDTKIRPSFPFSGSDPQRSRTMPNKISEAVQTVDPQRGYAVRPTLPGPGPTFGYPRSESVEPFPSRPVGPSFPRATARSGSHSNETGVTHSNGGFNLGEPVSRPQHSTQNSLGDVYDSYYNPAHNDQQPHVQREKTHQTDFPDEEMPNFDAVPHAYTSYGQAMAIDDHLPPQQIATKSPQRQQYQDTNTESSRPPAHAYTQMARSKSQPNFSDHRSHNQQSSKGFVFDLPRDAPPLPPMTPLKDSTDPRNFEYLDTKSQPKNQQARSRHEQRDVLPFNGSSVGVKSHEGGQQSLQQTARYRSPPPDNGIAADSQGITPGSRPRTANAMRPTSPPKQSTTNPDALPPHPTPIRPGLMQSSSSRQSANPPLIRQYSSSPSHPQQSSSINQPFAPPPLIAKRDSVPVTLEELERLRQVVKAKPSDQIAQLTLAKKLVEAASALVDDGGRADQKTKSKAREKYISDAHRIVKKLVNSNSTDAIFYLADCYSRGQLGLEVDTKEAFSLYQTAAKAGHAQSAYRVAVCCEMGQDEGGGTRRDPQKAMQWYKRAATLGDTPAMYKIGIIQLKGLLGQPKDPKEALIWLKRAADRADEENPHALHELALLHEGTSNTQLVGKDEAYSRQLFTKAANLGYKFSQFRLGCAYEYGLMGCPIDPRKSIAWYSQAAVQEEHQSELALSGWYLTGSEGVLQQSDTEAYLWARKAAQAGLAKAEYAMGYFTEVGIGAPINIEDAKRWYWRSACEYLFDPIFLGIPGTDRVPTAQNFPKAKERLEDLRKGGAKMQKARVSRSAIRKQSEGECSIM